MVSQETVLLIIIAPYGLLLADSALGRLTSYQRRIPYHQAKPFIFGGEVLLSLIYFYFGDILRGILWAAAALLTLFLINGRFGGGLMDDSGITGFISRVIRG